MSAYEWFRPHGSRHAVRRQRPQKYEFMEPPGRHQTLIVEPQPLGNLAGDISNLCNNQHVIHQRMEQLEGQQGLLVANSERLLHSGAQQSKQLDDLDHDLRYASRMHVRPEPPYFNERDVSYIAPRRTERLLLGGEGDIQYRHVRSRSLGRADRVYVGDGVTYVTSRHSRRTNWQPRHYAESDSSSDTASTVFDYEPARRPIRRPVVHQQPCVCGGVGYHLTDCPRRARW
jgi:hypothetical protein